jgi:xanthine dehydrogenase molybdopterin-binding subunit B|eukprot:COSAG02_NODE_337_length_24268_cov_7.498738_10_plen_127_part_00
MRAPTRLACKTFIETIVDHVAQLTGKMPEEVRAINLAKIPPKDENAATVPQCVQMGMTLLGGVGAPVPPGVPELPAKMFEAIKKSAGFDALAADTTAFNERNLWRKRGLAAMPTECKSNCCLSGHG